MWRSKKLIVAALLIAVVLVGSMAGVVLANEGEDENQQETIGDTLLNRVCEIYEENTGVAIDCTALQEAFAQVQSEKRDEAMFKALDKAVEEGRIDSDEAEAIKGWWGDRPETLGRNLFGHAFGFPSLGKHLRGGFGGWHCPRSPEPAD